jgi:hypothetical protein
VKILKLLATKSNLASEETARCLNLWLPCVCAARKFEIKLVTRSWVGSQYLLLLVVAKVVHPSSGPSQRMTRPK